MMHSKRSQEGYLLIDHRNAPGVTPARGVDAPAVAAGATFESATITCSHCHRIVILNPDRSRERHHCFKCDHYICDTCAAARKGVDECTTLHQVFDVLKTQAERALVLAKG